MNEIHGECECEGEGEIRVGNSSVANGVVEDLQSPEGRLVHKGVRVKVGGHE